MKIWLHKIEVFVDKLIPILLILLLVIIITELFFHEIADNFALQIDVFDGIIILFFVVDLSFKFSRVRKIPLFLRKYWLEIIATIPFFMVFRVLELFGISEFLRTGQQFVHSAELEKEAGLIVKEAGRVAMISRTERMARYIRIFARSPRFLEAIPFFEKPTGKHHSHEKIKMKKSS